jgi:MoaA/NifB/PqqE/SkfB family radical SAM enzyme
MLKGKEIIEWLRELEMFPEDVHEMIVPTSVTLDITHKCNFKCPGCIERTAMAKSRHSTLKTATVCDLMRQLATSGVRVLEFYGGETLLHPDIPIIIRLAAKLAFSIRIITNGSQLNRAEIVNSICESAEHTAIDIRISINSGCEETHEKLHGVAGAFQNILEGIQMLTKPPILPNLTVGLSYLAMEGNAYEIMLAYDIAARHQADYFSIRAMTGHHGIRIVKMSQKARNSIAKAVQYLSGNSTRPGQPELHVDRQFLEFLRTNHQPDTRKHYPMCFYCGNSRFVITPPDPGVAWACPYWRGAPHFKIADFRRIRYGSQQFEQCRLEATQRIYPPHDCADVICNRHRQNQAVCARLRSQTSI